MSALRSIFPPRLVEVLDADEWRTGHLEAWRREGDDWRAYVRYSVGVGMTHLGWVDSCNVRPVPTAFP